jgi:twitching motility protein PilT
MRAIPHGIRTVEQLPPAIGELADEERGIILVTGTTGSGKSTTLAAMIDRINSAAQAHRHDRGPDRAPALR